MNATVDPGILLDARPLTFIDSPTGDTDADARLALLLSLTEEQCRYYAHIAWLDDDASPCS